MLKEAVLANCAITDERYRGICKMLGFGDDPAEVDDKEFSKIEQVAGWFNSGQVKSYKEAKAKLDEATSPPSSTVSGDVKMAVGAVESAARQGADIIMYDVIPRDIQSTNEQVRAIARKAHQGRIIEIATDPNYADLLRPVIEEDLDAFLPESLRTPLPPGQV